MNAFRTSPKHRAIASLCAVCALIQPAHATTDISDVPMAVLNAVKPNIMFILDNSGSMEWRSITGTDALRELDDNNTEFYSSAYNQLWYDPNTLYATGVDKNSFTATNIQGSPMANSTPGAAMNNPYLSGKGTTDLTPACYYSGSTAPLKPALNSNCRPSINSTYSQGPIGAVAFYYEYTGPAGGLLTTPSNYTRRDIIPSIGNYARQPTRTDCAISGTTASCTYAQEIQNFANWWSYYRTRILTMKTTMGLAFTSLNDKYRMGFSTINDNNTTGNSGGANFIAIGDFDYAKKIAWYTQLYAIDPQSGTPLQRALTRVGEYYRGRGMGYSGNAGGDDPVQYSCQHNYAILSTDGFWNSNNVSLGNVDTTVPTLPEPLPTGTTPALVAGSSFPKPFYDANPTSNTLSDVAMYYWVTDLRTSGPLSTNNVSTSNADPASWQHMTTFTIGLGADGSKHFREDYLTATTNNWFYNNLINGSDNWPVPVADTNTAIDDLWHAAVNGRGQYFNAKNPPALRRALKNALDDIIARSGSAAAVAVANTDVSIDNTSYASSYNSGDWSGQLASYPITNNGTVSATPTWTAQSQLDTINPVSRLVATYSGTTGVQFRPYAVTPPTGTTTITSAQQAALDSTATPPGPADGTDVLNYIRGDRSGESGGTSVYRTRAHLLGDIVNGEPVVVTTPGYYYGDKGYAAFKAAQSVIATTAPSFVPTRIKTVFQGSNDGMVHAFDAATGAENWAYIPSFLLAANAPSPLRNLAKKDFVRRPLLDATPVVGDVDFNNVSSVIRPSPYVSDWKTLLIGGLGKGGRGYFALNVTTPTAASEADAANKVLWEFPVLTTGGSVNVTRPVGSGTAGAFTMNPNKVGYTFGRPVIVKTKAHGWVALVTSGYNNGTDTAGDGTSGTGGDGRGYLFVLDARTGALLHVFDTEAGTHADPSGLAHISAFVQSPMTNNIVEYVYGGDLLGNVWRFDLSSIATSQWSLQKLTVLQDASNNRQPVTTEPELGSLQLSSGITRVIYVGTGQYLGVKDVPGISGANTSATSTQSMYALVDDRNTSAAHTAPIRSNMQQRVLALSGGATCATATTSTTRNAGSANTPVNFATQMGWYVDLPCSGERINTAPVLAQGVLYFTSNIPNNDPCSPGGRSWNNALDFKDGNDATPAGSGKVGSEFLGNVLASRPILVQLPDGSVKVLIRTSDARTVTKAGKNPGVGNTVRRQTWKEIKRY